MRYVSTHKNVTSSFLRQVLVIFVSTRSWTKISINFIIEFCLNCYDNNIYDAILMMIDRFSKMTHYIFINLIWSIENLIDILFDKMLLIFFKMKKIVSDRKMLFTNDYWSALCYRIHVVKRFANWRLNRKTKLNVKTLFALLL